MWSPAQDGIACVGGTQLADTGSPLSEETMTAFRRNALQKLSGGLHHRVCSTDSIDSGVAANR